MRNKHTLTLMELLIMVLVFALAAALCLQAFAGADRISRQSARLDRAVTEAQSAAEVLSGCGGDWERAAALWGGSWDGRCWTLTRGEYTLQAAPEDSGLPLLGRAQIRVTGPEGELLFTLPVVWQKEGGGHD